VAALRVAAAILFALIAAAPAAAADEIDLGALAQCISDSGALFYGAHWCPYCRKQREYFEEHAGALPYVECYDGPKSNGKNSRCTREHIQSFPTWVFADGSRKTGARTPQQLAADTRCD
jgi:glutaredoxin